MMTTTKRLTRRILSVLLSIIMVLVAMPLSSARNQKNPVPHRGPKSGEDILGGHDYTDTDDAAFNALIDKLDKLLGSSGDLYEVLRAIPGVEDILTPMGINTTTRPINLTSVVDNMLNTMLFNDKMVNDLIQMLFPMLLKTLEDTLSQPALNALIGGVNLSSLTETTIWSTSFGNWNNGGILNANTGLTAAAKVKVTKLEILSVQHLYTLMSSVGTFQNIKLYPNLLASKIVHFPAVAAQLASATGPSGSWANKAYPTNAWEHANIYDSVTGKLKLNWGIDAAAPALRRQLFKDALTDIFDGVWFLLKALLAGKGLSGNYQDNTLLGGNNIATIRVTANGAVTGTGKVTFVNNFNINFGLSKTDNSTVNIWLQAAGIEGYSYILAPIFELLLGEDAAAMVKIKNPGAINSTADLVDGIIDPLIEFIDNMKAAPVSELLKLLPNIAAAFQEEKILPLVDPLKLNLVAKAGGTLTLTFDIPLSDITFGLVSNVTVPFDINLRNMLGSALDISIPTVELGPLLRDALEDLLDFESLLELVLDAVGMDPSTIPSYKLIDIKGYGTRVNLSTSKRVGTTTRQYIRADKAEVLYALLKWVLQTDMLTDLLPFEFTDLDEVLAALAELVRPKPYNNPPLQTAQPAWSTYDPYPEWWADLNSPAGKVKAKLDGDYILANADDLLNILWEQIKPAGSTALTFSQALIEAFMDMGANGEVYVSVVEMIQGLLGSLLGDDGMLADFQGLISELGIIGSQKNAGEAGFVPGTPYDIIAAANRLMPYDPIDNPTGYTMPAAGTVDTVHELMVQLKIFLAPIVPLLDVLFNGKNLDLLNVLLGRNYPTPQVPLAVEGLLRPLLGVMGYNEAIKPLLQTFTVPLGIPWKTTWDWSTATTAADKLGTFLDPIEEIYYKVLDEPVAGLLGLLPNLAYFVSANGTLASPLQQAVDYLFHPVYVLLDTLRPIFPIPLSASGLPAGLTLSPNEGFKIDTDALLGGFVNGRELIPGYPINLDLSKFLQGTWDGTKPVWDRTAVLFVLMDQLGMLDMIQDLGMVGLTKLIQYGGFPEMERIDYSAAPPRAANATGTPTWWKPSHAQFLVDNADAVLAWFWKAFIKDEPTVKAQLQQLLDDNSISITLQDSLPATIDTFWSSETYVKENLLTLVDMVLGFKDTIDGTVLPASITNYLGAEVTSLSKLLKLISIYDDDPSKPVVAGTNPKPLDLDSLLGPMEALYATDPVYLANTDAAHVAAAKAQYLLENPDASNAEADAYAAVAVRGPARAAAKASVAAASLSGVTNEASFMTKIEQLFAPLMPLLRVFLAESNILIVTDPRITDPTHTGTVGPLLPVDPMTGDPTVGNGFLRAYGYNGYEMGLLPLLLGIGADVPGFVDELKKYDTASGDFKTATETQQLRMILNPIMTLLDKLADNPFQTLLQVLPNVARFISDDVQVAGEKSLMRQAIDRLLQPILILFEEIDPGPAYPNSPLNGITGLLDGITEVRFGDEINALLAKYLPGWGINSFNLEELIVGAVQLFSQMLSPPTTGTHHPSTQPWLNDLGKVDTGTGLFGADYVEVDMPNLLTKLLSVTGAFENIKDFEALVRLLNVTDRDVGEGPGLIDYAKAPPEVSVASLGWLNAAQEKFLLDNMDAVINWAWREIIYTTAARGNIEAWLATTLGMPVSLAPTLGGTLQNLMGDFLYTRQNLTNIVNMLDSLKGEIDGVSFYGLTLQMILEKTTVLGNDPVDFDELFSFIDDYNPTDYPVTLTKAQFQTALVDMLKPLMPLLRVFLAESSIRLINDKTVNNPTNNPAMGDGFLIIDGYDGYRTGLLPVLMALGANVPGYLDELVLYDGVDGFKTAGDDEQIEAIINPLLYLLEKLAADPISTIVQVIPNVAYFAGGNDADSLLQQAINNMLHPLAAVLGALPDSLLGSGGLTIPDLTNLGLTSKINDALGSVLGGLTLDQLVVGLVKVFPARFNEMGVKGCIDGDADCKAGTCAHINKASYVETDKAKLLIQLLMVTGALDLLDDDTLAELAKLLNIDNKPPAGSGLIEYGYAPSATPVASLSWLTDAQANFLLDNVDGVIKWLWSKFIYGTPIQAQLEGMLFDALGTTVALKPTLELTIKDLLGTYLYTPGNFDLIAGALQNAKASIDAMPDILGVSVKEILGKAIKIDQDGVLNSLDIDGLFAALSTYVPGQPIADETAFKNKLVDLLAPFAPLLRIFLAEGDLMFIVDHDVNNPNCICDQHVCDSSCPTPCDYVCPNLGNGLAKVWGSDGWAKALLPILMGIGAQVPGFLDGDGGSYGGLVRYADFKTLSDTDMILAVLDPILYLLDKLIKDPVNTVIQVIPNLAYLLSDVDDLSLLQQALAKLAYPLKPVLPLLEGLWSLDELYFLENVKLEFSREINRLLGSVMSGLTMEKLVVGTITPFSDAALRALGLYNTAPNGARYVDVDGGLLLAQILTMTGVLDGVDDDLLAGLAKLLNLTNTPPAGPGLIEYAKGADAVNVTYPPWLKKVHTQFLVDNVDTVLEWAWAALFDGNTPGKEFLEEKLKLPAGTVQDSIKDTIEGLLGTYLYTPDNFDNLVQTAINFKSSLTSINVLGLPLADILEEAIKIDEGGVLKGLDINALFAGFDGYPPGAITDEASFKSNMLNMLEPLAPLLRIFLAEADLMFIVDPEVNNPNDNAQGDGLIKVFGSNGWATGLLPILMGIGATVPGFIDGDGGSYGGLVRYADFKTLNDRDMISAVIDPILYLLNKLATDPVNTIMQVLPNLAYFISDAKGPSLLQQAIDKILHPLAPVMPLLSDQLDVDLSVVTDVKLGDLLNGILGGVLNGLTIEQLVVGDITPFSDTALRALGVFNTAANGARYVDVDAADLLAEILRLVGAYELLEDNNLTGLVNLLNYKGRTKAGLPPIIYPKLDMTAISKNLYKGCWWSKKDAVGLSNRLEQFIDDIMLIITGTRVGMVPLISGGNSVASGFLREMLGEALYTQANFNNIVNGLQGALAGIDGAMEIVPGKTLADVLDGIVTLDGDEIDVMDIIDQLKGWTNTVVIPAQGDQDLFIDGLISFLKPAVPLLDFLLFGKDINVLSELPVKNGGEGDGMLTAFGYDGYLYGLIPVYEALLKPMNAPASIIKDKSDFETMTDEEKLQALLDPLLYAVEQIVTDPLDNLLKVLPNLAYFITPEGGSTLLQEAIDRAIYAVNNVFSSVTGAQGPLFSLDIHAEIDKLLGNLDFELAGLNSGILSRLRVGTLSEYASRSGAGITTYVGRYLSVLTEQDRADLLTVIFKTVIELVQNDKNREMLVTLVSNAIRPSGFGSTSVHWGIHLILWWHRLLGTNYSLDKIFCLMKFVNFFMPVIMWFRNLLSGLFGF